MRSLSKFLCLIRHHAFCYHLVGLPTRTAVSTSWVRYSKAIKPSTLHDLAKIVEFLPMYLDPGT